MTPPDAPDRDRAHDLKVKIPVRHHLQLHSIKILTGREISRVVEEALDAYFARHDASDPASR